MERLNKKTVIITGAARGLGKFMAGRLLSEGCNVVICDINEGDLEKTLIELKTKNKNTITGQVTDITCEKQVKKLVEFTLEKYERVDFLIANAGVSFSTPLHDIDLETWKKIIEINLFGYFLCAREVSKAMIPNNYGAIVQINSRTGKKGSPKNSAYAASKGGGIVLTQSLSAELAEFNIRVNCVCPGPMFESDLWQKVLFEDYSKRFKISVEEVRKKYIEEIPLKRDTKYADVANLVVFLLSDESDYITGQAINVSGGTIVW